jgi:O-methyltransferase
MLHVCRRTVKAVVRAILDRFGLQLVRAIGKKEYTLHYPYNDLVYAPWFSDQFSAVFKRVERHALVWEDRAYVIHMLSKHCSHLRGDFAECGVYKGGTAFLIADVIKASPEKGLHLFDTFMGMPATTMEERDGIASGALGDTSLDDVELYLREFSFVRFHAGLIPDTLASVKQCSFAFVHVDVDTFNTTLDCCQFFYDRLVPGGVLLCDDYGVPIYNVKAAIDSFFNDKPESPIVLGTGQCMAIKL